MRGAIVFRPAVLLALGAAVGFSTGCVRRTLRITSEPTNALVLLNDQEVGRTDVSTDFLWYGDYDVVIRKDGWQTLQTGWTLKPPWYQVPPFDFIFEVLWPGRLHDVRERHFVLQPQELPTSEEVIQRAVETRDAALSPGG